MKNVVRQVVRGVVVVTGCWLWVGSTVGAAPEDLWALARQNADIHRFSTLFTAQDVRDRLAADAGVEAAMDWCRRTAITKVYLESFRDGYQAERAALERARDRFRTAGFEVAGCITTTGLGKRSTGWNVISCYTDLSTQEKLQAIFEYNAALFDEIMIDDFWFTDCTCAACDRARQARRVTVGTQTYPVAGETWVDYRGELMVRLSRDRILDAVRRVNPRARVIVKYPQWYDRFHERGYDVARQTADFDRIWVGTETRDYRDPRWGGTVQYEAYFIMRWLGGLGGAKCGGGWYDWLGTTEATYLEQARQTVLAGARESLLFCYGGLQRDTGPANVAALRRHLPELLTVARAVLGRRAVGIAAFKPPNSPPESEPRVFDFVGMLGLPLAPCHEFPARAPAGFFSLHALKEPDLERKLTRFIRAGKPVLLTDGLANRLAGRVPTDAANVQVLRVKGDPKSLLELPAEELASLRAPLLRPFRASFAAPSQVALYLFGDGSWVIENFNDRPVPVVLNGREQSLGARSWAYAWK
jgi:hypothetical protein